MAGLVSCFCQARPKQVHGPYVGGSLRSQTEDKGGLK